MATISVASSMATQCQIQLQRCRSPNVLACYEKVQRECYGLPRLSCFGNSVIRTKRRSYGALESRRCYVETGRLRTFVVRAQKDEKKDQRQLDEVERKSLDSWTSSIRNANMTSRIFMAAFVWISLFFGISVTNNEMSGGRPPRRGPRK